MITSNSAALVLASPGIFTEVVVIVGFLVIKSRVEFFNVVKIGIDTMGSVTVSAFVVERTLAVVRASLDGFFEVESIVDTKP